MLFVLACYLSLGSFFSIFSDPYTCPEVMSGEYIPLEDFWIKISGRKRKTLQVDAIGNWARRPVISTCLPSPEGQCTWRQLCGDSLPIMCLILSSHCVDSHELLPDKTRVTMTISFWLWNKIAIFWIQGLNVVYAGLELLLCLWGQPWTCDCLPPFPECQPPYLLTCGASCMLSDHSTNRVPSVASALFVFDKQFVSAILCRVGPLLRELGWVLSRSL